MPLIRAGGREVHVQEMGEGSPLVLIHPMTFSLAMWYLTVAPLLAREYRVIMYDLRGHGRSEFAPDGYDFGTLGEDLLALLESFLGPSERPVHVGGYSSGATLALRFAVDHPDWVRTLNIVDAPLPPFDTQERIEERGGDREALLDEVVGQEVEVTAGSRREDLRTNLKHRLRTKTTLFEDFENEPGFWDELPVVEKPALLLYGDESPFLEVGERLSDVLPRGDFQVIPGSHTIPLNQREVVAERMLAFLP